MRKCFTVILLLLLFISCDDGDIIVTTLDFEDTEMNMCGSEETRVLYKVNNNNIFETISLKFTDNRLSKRQGLLLSDTIPSLTFALNENNKVIYRSFDSEVPSNYFCQEIPPSSPKVLRELVSVGGTVTITTIVDQNITDHDKDGIPSAEEGMATELDSDGDGIPDFLDVDDDGDNVSTKTELIVSDDNPTNPDTGRPDSDLDGIPDYLDVDDDGDGVDTKLEVTEASQDPAHPANINEAGIARYLDVLVSEPFAGELTFIIVNTISRQYVSSIVISNLQLQDRTGDSEEISFESYRFGTFTSNAVNVVLAPETEQPEPDPEE